MTKVFIKTYGCSLNASDSEAMAGLLQEEDYEIIHNEEDADVIVINSCSVKGKTQSAFEHYLKKVEKEKKVVVTGCIPQSQPNKIKHQTVLGPHQLQQIPIAVQAAKDGEVKQFLQRTPEQRLNLPKVRKNPLVEIIPINKGCLNACTFCSTKFSRGHLQSYRPREIREQAELAIKEGVKEIWLTSPDTATYGKDIETNLPDLLQSLCNLEGDFKIRLGMGNPNWFIHDVDKLIEVFKTNDKLFKFLHVPFQAGSNEVLEQMKRGYTIDTYLEIVNKFRKHIPEMTIATDIIVGFPGETDEQFQETITILKQSMPDIVNLSRFAPRPGTPAKKMSNQVHDRIKKERSKLTTDIMVETMQERNKFWLNWEGEITISEIGKHSTLIGRNFSYKQIIIPESQAKMGQKVKVKITDVTEYDLRGKVI